MIASAGGQHAARDEPRTGKQYKGVDHADGEVEVLLGDARNSAGFMVRWIMKMMKYAPKMTRSPSTMTHMWLVARHVNRAAGRL